MSSRALATTAIVSVFGAAIVAGVAALAARDDGADGDGNTLPSSNDAPAPGRVFAIDRGDPVDVGVRRDARDASCIAISGDPYLTSQSCPTTAAIRSHTGFTVAFPVSGTGPVLVIGFVPGGARRAVVTAGDSTALGEVRGSVFLATLPPDALGPAGDAAVTVEFG